MAYLLWQHLAENAKRQPDRPAVAWRGAELSYLDLHRQSDRLAALLRSEGVGLGHRVGMNMPKQARSIVTMLGILKTGAAYVPIDPTAPARRAAYVMNDCAVSALVTTQAKLKQLENLSETLPSVRAVVLADAADGGAVAAHPTASLYGWSMIENGGATEHTPAPSVESDPAYILYTSGSTGKPKGVVISHRNALAFVDWAAETVGVVPEDRLSNHAPLHFDLSVLDIYVALRQGACVVPVPDTVAPFPFELASWIQTEGISVWYSVPSALTRLLLHGAMERFAYERLRTVLFAGEVFPTKYLRQIMDVVPHARLVNLYGPTETNVCTWHDVPRPLDASITDLSIGRACANTEVFAAGPDGQPVGPGEEGELLVRGPTVMLGYWGLPDRTRAVLMDDPRGLPFDQKVYRTGDIVRPAVDGTYAFVGRRDHMVKSRGYRIELGEIEQALYEHPSVREVVVVPLPDEEIGARLHAIVAAHAGTTVAADELRSHCAARLPRYMVPESFDLSTTDLPRTSTGKIDRLAVTSTLTDRQETSAS